MFHSVSSAGRVTEEHQPLTRKLAHMITVYDLRTKLSSWEIYLPIRRKKKQNDCSFWQEIANKKASRGHTERYTPVSGYTYDTCALCLKSTALCWKNRGWRFAGQFFQSFLEECWFCLALDSTTGTSLLSTLKNSSRGRSITSKRLWNSVAQCRRKLTNRNPSLDCALFRFEF